MRKVLRLVLASTLLCVSCVAPRVRPISERVLFVGNSLTYVGNLPAVFSALASANNHVVSCDMIVKGGATLTQRVADGSVAQALEQHTYSALLIQERGGDLTCSYGPDSCIQSGLAITALARLAQEKGVNAVLLGTYQPWPETSRRLVDKEAVAASDAGIPYIEVSEKLQRLRSAAPELTWFYSDGMHPGKDLTLLDAIVIYRQLFGSDPATKSFAVKAPIYANKSGLTATLRADDDPPPKADTPLELTYDSATIAKLIAIVNEPESR